MLLVLFVLIATLDFDSGFAFASVLLGVSLLTVGLAILGSHL